MEVRGGGVGREVGGRTFDGEFLRSSNGEISVIVYNQTKLGRPS